MTSPQRGVNNAPKSVDQQKEAIIRLMRSVTDNSLVTRWAGKKMQQMVGRTANGRRVCEVRPVRARERARAAIETQQRETERKKEREQPAAPEQLCRPRPATALRRRRMTNATATRKSCSLLPPPQRKQFYSVGQSVLDLLNCELSRERPLKYRWEHLTQLKTSNQSLACIGCIAPDRFRPPATKRID